MCSDSYSQSDKKSVGYCPECDRSVDEDGGSIEILGIYQTQEDAEESH